ncbi:MAG: hypothetical protein AAF799_16625 [Myxococcota bacterium]
MTALPEALRPWGQPLSMFVRLVHEHIGPWLSALRDSVGPMWLPRRARSGDPDGVDGLAPRGTYDRLLLSEWAIAMEFPQEFLRRAVMGEHMFVAPAFQQPHGAHTSIALLDCGPSQLGAPRLAQLATLIVLSQRAKEAGAKFRFGVLQDEEHQLHELDRNAISAWLRARTWAPPPRDTTVWKDALQRLDAKDAWVVGAPSTLPTARALGAGLLSIEEPVFDAERVLHVSTHPVTAVGAQLDLPLPPDDVSVRIFRAPLASAPRRARRPHTPVVPGQVGQLSCDGRRLLLPVEGGEIHSFHVPGRLSDSVGRTKKVESLYQSRLIGADLWQRRLVAISLGDDGHVRLRGAGLLPQPRYDDSKTISTEVSTGLSWPESLHINEGGVLEFYVVRAESRRFEAYLYDHHQQLWNLEVGASPGSDSLDECHLDVLDRGCRGLRRLRRELFVWSSLSAGRVCTTFSKLRPPQGLDAEALETCVFGASTAVSKDASPAAYPDATGSKYRLWGTGETTELSVPPGSVIGLDREAGWHEAKPMLLVLDPDRRTLRATNAKGTTAIYSSPVDITQAKHDPACRRVVLLGENGDITVFDVGLRQVVLQLPRASREKAS